MLATIRQKVKQQRFFAGEAPQKAPYHLTQRRVYILPTKQGLTFALLLFVMLIGSINYSNSLGYFLTFLLASLFVVAIFHTYNNLLKLSIGPAICKPVFCSKPAHILLQLNNSNHHKRLSITVHAKEGLKTTHDIPANEISVISIQHKYNKRGYNALPRMTIETTFPLGLFRAWAIVVLDQKQLVYAKPSSDRYLPAQSTGHSEGNKQYDHGSDDFKGLRSYIPGDPLQHIHWKSYARHHTLQTKEFSSTTSDELTLNWNDTTTHGTENKLSQMTRWVMLCHQQNRVYALQLPGITLPAGHGHNHYEQCLKQLAIYKTDVN